MNVDIGPLEYNMELIRKLKPTLFSYNETIQRANCDKFGLGFNLDSRFSDVKLEVSLDSWTGFYGNSGCATHVHVGNTALFKVYFLEYLNDHCSEILDSILTKATEKVKIQKEHALNQLEKAQQEINSLEN